MRSEDSLPASMLRQWAYCPRIPFFREVLGIFPATPGWVEQGIQSDILQTVLSRDRRFRTLSAQGLKRLRRVPLYSARLGLHGIADLILRGEDRFIVCDFKLYADRIERGTRLQLGAYAIMAEEAWSIPCCGIAVLTGKPVRAILAEWSDGIRAETEAATAALWQALASGYLPPSNAGPAKCGICEYLNHCNDRD
jgi:CRISPR-associated exonuclease Cas4